MNGRLTSMMYHHLLYECEYYIYIDKAIRECQTIDITRDYIFTNAIILGKGSLNPVRLNEILDQELGKND